MQSSQHQGSEAARLVWIVGSPIIYAIGVPGNLITILVLLRSNYKKTSTSVFLTFVAIADLLVLLLLLPRWWIIYVFDFDIRLISNAFCKLHWFITYTSGCMSVAFLVAVTAERIISITRPYKVKTWCTVNTAIITSLTIVMFQIVFHGHNLYGMKLFSVTHYDLNDGVNSSIQCQGDKPVFLNGTAVTSQVFPKDIDDKTASLAPNVCTAHQLEVCVNNSKSNGLIDQENNFQNNSCGIQLLNKKEIDVCWFDDPVYGQFSMGVYQLMIIFIYNVITEGSILVGMIVIIRQLAISKRLRKRMKLDLAREKDVHSKKLTFESHSAQITRSLLLVNAIFIICGTPVQIFLAGRAVWIDSETGMSKAQELIWAVVNMLFYFNHAVNFILYFLSGSRFRKQVKETLKCNRQGKKLHEMSLSNIRSATEIAYRRSNNDFGQSVTSNQKDIFNFNEIP